VRGEKRNKRNFEFIRIEIERRAYKRFPNAEHLSLKTWKMAI